MTFMKETTDGEKVCPKIIHKIMNKNAHDQQQIQMLDEMDEGKIDDIIGYNRLCQWIEGHKEKEPGGDFEEVDQY